MLEVGHIVYTSLHGFSVFALMQIAFDNGDVELVCLDSESWETLSHESMGQQVNEMFDGYFNSSFKC